MGARSHRLTVAMTACYLLAVTASSLFHSHHTHCDEHSPPGVSASHESEDHECSVCQFLAQKPAPAADVAPETAYTLVQDVAAPSPAHAARGVFAAWHSRAPPGIA